MAEPRNLITDPSRRIEAPALPDKAKAKGKNTGHLGPAMLALTDKQRAFVHALVQTGCSNTEAARQAGYSASNVDTIKARGWDLAHDAKVQEAIKEEGFKVLRSHALPSIQVMAEIAQDKRAANRDRLRAAAELLNRSGFNAPTEQVITVQHTHDQATQVAQVIEMAKALGLDPRPLLASAGVVVDAEFTVINGPDDPQDDDEE